MPKKTQQTLIAAGIFFVLSVLFLSIFNLFSFLEGGSPLLLPISQILTPLFRLGFGIFGRIPPELVIILFPLVITFVSLVPVFILSFLLLRVLKLKVRKLHAFGLGLIALFLASFVLTFLPREDKSPDEMPGNVTQMFLPQYQLNRLRCQIFPPPVSFLWTVPENGATGVRTQTAIVANLTTPNETSSFYGSLTDSQGNSEHVGQSLAFHQNIHTMVPSTGAADMAEFETLSNPTQNEATKLITHGSLKPYTKYIASYTPTVNGCQVYLTFSFTTGPHISETPTVSDQEFRLPGEPGENPEMFIPPPREIKRIEISQ